MTDRTSTVSARQPANQHGSARDDSTGELKRFNVVLSDSESVWLDQLAEEIHTTPGAKISRSETSKQSSVRHSGDRSPGNPSSTFK